MSLGIIILGVILAVIGYVLDIKTTGPLNTLGKILLFVGIIIAVIGIILLLIGLVGVALAFLPIVMLA